MFDNFLKTFGIFIGIPSIIVNLIQYRKNKKFEKYANEKELEIKMAELEKENGEHTHLNSHVLHNFNESEIEHTFKVQKLEVEIKYLLKILNKK